MDVEALRACSLVSNIGCEMFAAATWLFASLACYCAVANFEFRPACPPE